MSWPVAPCHLTNAARIRVAFSDVQTTVFRQSVPRDANSDVPVFSVPSAKPEIETANAAQVLLSE
jgi:hypothetical protein